VAADDLFANPFVDVDEWRDAPVRHRYVHGGFSGTETRFSYYFPPVEQYAGRFFQHVTPVPDSELLAQEATGEEDRIGMSLSSGAYFVETNGGGTGGHAAADRTIGAYRANAAAAEFSRVVATEMYGGGRPFGYLYGGSGGGFRTIGCAENTTGVWDGFVPYVIGSPMAIPNMFTVRMHAMRILRERFDQVVDAVEPGGSGDPYSGLDQEERDALLELSRMGFPLRSCFGHRTMGMHAFPVLYQGMRQADPAYFEEFWSLPGYLGHSAPPSLLRDRVQHRCEVTATLDSDEATALRLAVGRQPGQSRGGVDTAWQGAPGESVVPVAVRLSAPTPREVHGGELLVLSGGAAGARLGLLAVAGDVATFGPADPALLLELRPGDLVEVDNSGYLAAQSYHRHQVPGPEFPVWDQFRRSDGTPAYPQRPLILGPLFAAGASGTVQNGRFAGKMIVVEALLDREALPWQADWYRARVEEHLGASTDEHFRLWFVDNALHGDQAVQEHPTHTISYLGVLHQALRDVSAWVEKGIAPLPSTRYEVVDGQVVVPASAAERRGVQPVLSLTADGGARADVAPGQQVELRLEAAVPEGAGAVVAVEWDLDGSGGFDTVHDVTPADAVVATRRHAFSEVGTHFVAARVVAHRDADPRTPYARIQNVARVRVVVT
jgi:hypothetical protein